MAKKEKNKNSILFLYEGETEGEFYKKLFSLKIPERQIRINRGNLNGVYSLDSKVKSKVQSYLQNSSSTGCNAIHIIVAYDREGDRSTPPSLNLPSLEKELVYPKSRIKSISHVVATQDLESWFFHDMPGIYKYLSVPAKERKPEKHPNVDATHNRILSQLFHRYKKHYQKGKKAEGFIDALDLQRIVDQVPELQQMITHINTLAN